MAQLGLLITACMIPAENDSPWWMSCGFSSLTFGCGETSEYPGSVPAAVETLAAYCEASTLPSTATPSDAAIWRVPKNISYVRVLDHPQPQREVNACHTGSRQMLGDELTRAVIGHVAAALDLVKGRVAGREHVLLVCAAAQRDDVRVLDGGGNRLGPPQRHRQQWLQLRSAQQQLGAVHLRSGHR